MLNALIVLALSTAPPTSSPALLGSWSGPQVVLDVRADGALIRLDCGEVRTGEPLVLKGGDFKASGRSSRYKPGPQLADEDVPGTVVTLSGSLRGDTLDLVIREQGRSTQLYTLTRGRGHKLVRCL